MTLDAGGLEEWSVDGEESWSDYTYASGNVDTSDGEDRGMISEPNPLVVFVESGLDVANIDGHMTFGDSLAPVNRDSGKTSLQSLRKRPIVGFWVT
jgi:hypothetical protein